TGIQVELARFLRSQEVEIVPLDGELARSCGELCGATGTSDVIDASVVILAREHRDSIVTSDPDDRRSRPAPDRWSVPLRNSCGQERWRCSSMRLPYSDSRSVPAFHITVHQDRRSATKTSR